MAKQTFTTGQVLSAAQMTALQQTAMLGGAANAKVASYTLVAADAGDGITMNNAGATTITVNNGLFAEGDIVTIINIGTGATTITAGTATVTTSGSLVLATNQGGILRFTSASAAIFLQFAIPAAAGGKVLQVVQTTYSTSTTIASTTFTDTGLSLAITPTSATSRVLVFVNQSSYIARGASNTQGSALQILRGATVIHTQTDPYARFVSMNGASEVYNGGIDAMTKLDSPATTSATTYKVQAKINTIAQSGAYTAQIGSSPSVITLMEIGA